MNFQPFQIGSCCKSRSSKCFATFLFKVFLAQFYYFEFWACQPIRFGTLNICSWGAPPPYRACRAHRQRSCWPRCCSFASSKPVDTGPTRARTRLTPFRPESSNNCALPAALTRCRHGPAVRCRYCVSPEALKCSRAHALSLPPCSAAVHA